jgi:hypothetical protein
MRIATVASKIVYHCRNRPPLSAPRIQKEVVALGRLEDHPVLTDMDDRWKVGRDAMVQYVKLVGSTHDGSVGSTRGHAMRANSPHGVMHRRDCSGMRAARSRFTLIGCGIGGLVAVDSVNDELVRMNKASSLVERCE